MQDCLIREAYCKNRVGDVGDQSRSQGLVAHLIAERGFNMMRLRYSRPHSSVPASVQALSPPPPLCLSLSCPAQLPNATPPLILLIHQINLGRLVMTSVLKRKDKERVVMLRQHRQSSNQCFGVALTNEYCRNTLLKDFLIHCRLIFLQLCRYQV